MQPHIYLDMDGVMTDWVGGILRTSLAPRGVEEDSITSWNIESHLGISSEILWDNIDFALWWQRLESYPWATPLFEMLTYYAPVTYLSSPGRSGAAAEGKIAWIQDRHGFQFSDWILTNHKDRVAAPGRILIDDSEKNCAAWEAAGGFAVLVPQYWNRGRALRATFGRSNQMSGQQIQEFIASLEAAVKGALS